MTCTPEDPVAVPSNPPGTLPALCGWRAVLTLPGVRTILQVGAPAIPPGRPPNTRSQGDRKMRLRTLAAVLAAAPLALAGCTSTPRTVGSADVETASASTIDEICGETGVRVLSCTTP